MPGGRVTARRGGRPPQPQAQPRTRRRCTSQPSACTPKQAWSQTTGKRKPRVRGLFCKCTAEMHARHLPTAHPVCSPPPSHA
eukprot:271448-Chlamydomonas_euryale.AAC.1